MIKLTWKSIVDIHNQEKNARRTAWRVIGYGMIKKNRRGYTASQLQFILQKNFKGFTDEQWGMALVQMIKTDYIGCIDGQKEKLYCLTEQGLALFNKKYDI